MRIKSSLHIILTTIMSIGITIGSLPVVEVEAQSQDGNLLVMVKDDQGDQ